MSKPMSRSCRNFTAHHAGHLEAGEIDPSNVYKIDWSDVNQYRRLQGDLSNHLSVTLSGQTKTWDIARASLGSVEQIFAHMGRNFLVDIKRHESEHHRGVTVFSMPAVASLCAALYAFGSISPHVPESVEKTQRFRAAPALWSDMKRKASVQITEGRKRSAANLLADHVNQLFVGVWLEKSCCPWPRPVSGKGIISKLVPR